MKLLFILLLLSSCTTSQFYYTRGYIDKNNRVRITGPKTPINLQPGDSVDILIQGFKPKHKQ